MDLTQGLHRAVQQHPNAVATVCADRVRTHAESLERVARLAAGLRKLGVRDGARAAILSRNSDRYHEFLAATLWAGGVAVPVNLRWSVPEITDSLVEVDARLLVVDDAFAGHAEGIRAGHPRLAHVVHAGDGPVPDGALDFEALIGEHEPVEDARRGGDDLALAWSRRKSTAPSAGPPLRGYGRTPGRPVAWPESAAAQVRLRLRWCDDFPTISTRCCRTQGWLTAPGASQRGTSGERTGARKQAEGESG